MKERLTRSAPPDGFVLWRGALKSLPSDQYLAALDPPDDEALRIRPLSFGMQVPFGEEILSAVSRKRVVVICGESGSGKTTQVPQFIFEHWVRKGMGSRCNIVITQPRRFAAVSVVKRVATERRDEANVHKVILYQHCREVHYHQRCDLCSGHGHAP
ncbi:hypothetical protein MRX96_044878 [Rhipicephalus microplus]